MNVQESCCLRYSAAEGAPKLGGNLFKRAGTVNYQAHDRQGKYGVPVLIDGDKGAAYASMFRISIATFTRFRATKCLRQLAAAWSTARQPCWKQ